MKETLKDGEFCAVVADAEKAMRWFRMTWSKSPLQSPDEQIRFLGALDTDVVNVAFAMKAGVDLSHAMTARLCCLRHV